ncbi:MAG: ribonuclease D [Deltaproteobacteria bacterium]|nr:ribonuclease D [Deltaproteobacteria bacterium]
MNNHCWTFVNTPAKLMKAEKAIRSAPVIALDTEYDSFRYFHEKLCLLQIQVGEHTWLIDPLAEGLDLSFLGDVLLDPEILKIFHAGDNDIRILKRDYAFGFRNIFDTHRAASLLGFKQLGLSTLLEIHLGVTLEKKMQRSRWDIRPLSEAQLDYAALDTAHLPGLHRKLDAALREKGVEKEAKHLFVGMTAVVWRPKTLDRLGHRRLPGYGHLTSEQRERLRLLYRWRFEKARELNRACFMLLSDPQLVALARLESPSQEALTGRGLLSADSSQCFGPEILPILQSN